MTKKNFKQYMNRLLELKHIQDELNDVLKKIDPDFNFICLSKHEDLIVDLIQECMNDEADWVQYWLYELDEGKRAKKDSVRVKGKNVPIKTLDDLYNLINI